MTDRKTDPARLDPDALDALLAQAASQDPPPLPDRLRARLQADALARMPAPARAAARPDTPGALAQLWRMLGGSPGFAGLTAAGLAGLWIGAAPPAAVAGLSATLWEGAALVSPEIARRSDEAPPGFDEDDLLLALLSDD